jgi:hypothetical protein
LVIVEGRVMTNEPPVTRFKITVDVELTMAPDSPATWGLSKQKRRQLGMTGGYFYLKLQNFAS